VVGKHALRRKHGNATVARVRDNNEPATIEKAQPSGTRKPAGGAAKTSESMQKRAVAAMEHADIVTVIADRQNIASHAHADRVNKLPGTGTDKAAKVVLRRENLNAVVALIRHVHVAVVHRNTHLTGRAELQRPAAVATNDTEARAIRGANYVKAV
jgi:hypothetical protein